MANVVGDRSVEKAPATRGGNRGGRQSSHIVSIHHDDNYTLHVTFKNGATYAYPNVPADVVAQLQRAGSLGTHFHRFIKPKYQGKRL